MSRKPVWLKDCSPFRPLCLVIIFLLTLAVPSLGQHCDCAPGMQHLCRCNVLIDPKIAKQQLDYLNRLLLAEFREYLDTSPLAHVRVGKPEEMFLQGEAALGYIDTDTPEGTELVLSPALRRDEALMVLAHELGHAWHFSSRPDADDIEDFLAEGFAEWVSYHLTRRAGLTEFSYRIKAGADPIYGQGFHWFYDIEQQHGVGAVLSIMLNWIDRSGRRL